MTTFDLLYIINGRVLAFWLIFILFLVLWLWSVVTVAKAKTKDPLDRIVWLLIVLLLNVVGTLLYLCFGPALEEDFNLRKTRSAENKPDYKSIKLTNEPANKIPLRKQTKDGADS